MTDCRSVTVPVSFDGTYRHLRDVPVPRLNLVASRLGKSRDIVIEELLVAYPELKFDEHNSVLAGSRVRTILAEKTDT